MICTLKTRKKKRNRFPVHLAEFLHCANIGLAQGRSMPMNGKIRNMIKGYARRLSSSWPPRVACKEAAKVAPALHKCAKCGSLNYEGDSQKNYEKYVEQFPNDVVNFDGIEVDHIKPVIELTGWTTWDDYFDGLFCDQENFRCLCNTCHSAKSSAEATIRFKGKRKK